MSLSRISDLHNVKSITLRGVNHSVGRHINKFYGLADVIKAFVDNDALPEFSEIGTLAYNKVRTKKIFQANQQYLIEDYEGALSFAMEVLEEDPMSEPANFVAGMAEIGLKRYTAASRHLAVTCALVPHFNTAQFHLAKALRLSGRLEQAAQHFTRYISVMPNSVGARRNLSSIYKALGNQKASAEWTARADEVDAKNKEAEALKRSMSAAKKS
ncbi:hypothetical protein CR511_06970 [Pseudomonas putida]|nr:hypothetical protein CR511_06970 [Pseudomonas putida]